MIRETVSPSFQVSVPDVRCNRNHRKPMVYRRSDRGNAGDRERPVLSSAQNTVPNKAALLLEASGNNRLPPSGPFHPGKAGPRRCFAGTRPLQLTLCPAFRPQLLSAARLRSPVSLALLPDIACNLILTYFGDLDGVMGEKYNAPSETPHERPV